MKSSIYNPSDDSYLLLNYVPCKGKILEMGCGSGLIAVYCAKKGADVLAVDINPEAVKYTKKIAARENVEIEVRESNLFYNVDGKFDFIFFNPPYLPGEPKDMQDKALSGRRGGIKVAGDFLKEAKKYLKEDGEIYMVLSSFSDIESLRQNFSQYKFEEIDKKKLFFETLYVFKLVI